MKKLLLTSVAVLLMTTSAAQAGCCEYFICGKIYAVFSVEDKWMEAFPDYQQPD
jgi:hypothetical protein